MAIVLMPYWNSYMTVSDCSGPYFYPKNGGRWEFWKIVKNLNGEGYVSDAWHAVPRIAEAEKQAN